MATTIAISAGIATLDVMLSHKVGWITLNVCVFGHLPLRCYINGIRYFNVILDSY